MAAPDKIYVPQYIIQATSVQKLDKPIVAGSTEYIRKDALLEWAKENNKMIDTTEDGDYRLGYLSSMIDLIEKIESL